MRYPAGLSHAEFSWDYPPTVRGLINYELHFDCSETTIYFVFCTTASHDKVGSSTLLLVEKFLVLFYNVHNYIIRGLFSWGK